MLYGNEQSEQFDIARELSLKQRDNVAERETMFEAGYRAGFANGFSSGWCRAVDKCTKRLIEIQKRELKSQLNRE